MSYWVVRYDVLSMAKDASYRDLRVEAPAFIRNYNSFGEADGKAKELGESSGGDDVELDLKNDKHYKGKRYVYGIAEDYLPAEENFDAAETESIRRADDGVHQERPDEHSAEPRP